MSRNPTDSDSFDETLESAHRTLRRLEVDTYRLRTDLTRLEAALEDGIAGVGAIAPPREVNVPVEREPSASGAAAEAVWSEPLTTDNVLIESAPIESTPAEFARFSDFGSSESVEPDAKPIETESITSPTARKRPLFRRTTRPMAASLSVHGVLLLMIVSIGVAKVVHDEKPFGTLVDLGKKPPAPVEKVKELDLGQIDQLDETNLKDAAPVSEAVGLGDSALADVTPGDFETVSALTSVGDLGAVTALKPIDTGEGTFQPAGNGGTGADGMEPAAGGGNGKGRGAGGGRKGGPVGAAMFFGTKAKGDRFVFVVDNSSSMKNGRLELALAELVKTVGSLTPKQSF